MPKSCYWLVLLAPAWLCHPAAAQTPFPEFTGQRLYVSGVPDVYQPLVAQIERLERASPQTYYVVVVESSGSGQWATRDYLDNMYQQWLAQAVRKGLAIDPDRAVIIVLAQKNRQISVKTGTLLQSQYGLRDQVLDRQLVQPHFIPHAKAGNYLAGLERLLNEIDKTIAAKDTAVERARQEAVAREEELKRNAETTVQSARQLLLDVRSELAAKESAGMELDQLEARTAQAAGRLEKLGSNPPGQMAAVLQEASAAQQELQAVRANLLQLAAQQKQAAEQLQAAQASALQLQETLVGHRRNGLATEPIATELEEIWKQLETSQAALGRRPDQGMALVQTAAERLAGLKTRLEQLPQTAQQAQERLSAVTAQRSELDRQLQQAQQIGTDTRATQEQIEQLDRELAGAREAAQADYSLALAELEELQTALAAQQQRVAAAYEQRYLVTRTAPLSGVSIAMLLGVAIVSGLRWRHTRLKRQVGQRLSAFRSEVTQWMERLDGLKQRHQYLPFTDTDFTEPMTGQTLALYNDVQARYDTLRTLWLALMDRRTKAEGVFELENSLGVKRLKEVDQLLAGREDTTQLEPQFRQCVEILDRLNQAHEEAAQARRTVEAALAALAERIALLSKAPLPTDALENEVSEATEAFQRGMEIAPSDPLGGREAFEDVHRQLTALGAVCQRRLACVDRVRGLEQQAAAARQRVLELRSGGIRLSESSADPDPLLSEAARRLAESWTALEQANDAAAETLAEQAGALAADARQRMEQHLADREFTLQQTPTLREGLAVLRERLKQAFAQQQELEAAFHRDSWSLVAENASHAAALIETLAGLVERATGAAAEDVQHYSLAAQHLKEGELTRQQAQALIAAAGRRLDELQKFRSQAAMRRQEVAESSRRVETFLGQHTRIIGDEAQGLWSQAQAAIEQAEAAASHSQPHWPQILAQLDRAAGELSAALERAENDVRSHAQLMAELSQARARAASVGQLLRSHTADRPRANHRFQGALEVIEATARASDQPGAAWARLLEQLRQAAVDVEQSRRWAEEDIRLAEQAAAAVRSAESEFQRSRTFVSFGVSTNMSAAESQLAQARHQLQSQDYEQAISLAEAAERAARQAHLEAVREADERRRRQEDERRRREMQRMAASAAAMTMGSRRSGGSFSSSSSSSRSTSSSSSWSSGTSQSSW